MQASEALKMIEKDAEPLHQIILKMQIVFMRFKSKGELRYHNGKPEFYWLDWEDNGKTEQNPDVMTIKQAIDKFYPIEFEKAKLKDNNSRTMYYTSTLKKETEEIISMLKKTISYN